MEKKACEKCKKAKATVRCTRNHNLVVWWYCERCYKEVAGDEPTASVIFKPEGFPMPDYAPVSHPGILIMADVLARYPEGPVRSEEDLIREHATWHWVLTGRMYI